MKFLARAFVFSVFALWLTSQFIPAFRVSGGVGTYLMGGLVFSILDLIVKPMLKILFIPIDRKNLEIVRKAIKELEP